MAANIMQLADAMTLAVGTGAYMAARTELEQAVYCALHQPTGAQLVRSGVEATAMLQVDYARAMDLVRRASQRMRDLHEELAQAHARIAMLEDPAPGLVHGTTAANAEQARVVA